MEDVAPVTARWRDRSVLVTGATGMVGSWLVKELLAGGAHVVALVRDADPQSELYRSGDVNKVSVVNGSLEDFWTVERAVNENDVDTVFHLGAQALVAVAHRSPLATLESNVRGTYHVLEACRLHQARVRRVVVASSDKAYGLNAPLPYTEDLPLAGKHPYEVSKTAADLVAQAYHHTYGVPVAIARCGNIYGGGDLNWSRIVPGTTRSFLNRARPILRSDGTYVRDYLYVKDAARAYVRLADGLDDAGIAGEAFNFSTEQPMTVLQVVRAIQRLTDALDIEPDILASTEGEIHSQSLSAAKARTMLAWKSEFDFEVGLRETIAWYRAFLRGGS